MLDFISTSKIKEDTRMLSSLTGFGVAGIGKCSLVEIKTRQKCISSFSLQSQGPRKCCCGHP